MRSEILKFAQKMDHVMELNDPEKGDSYKNMEISELTELLTEQYNDLTELCVDVENPSFSQDEKSLLISSAIKQCTDVGNFAMMIATNLEVKLNEL